jgi:hypothetical protein
VKTSLWDDLRAQITANGQVPRVELWTPPEGTAFKPVKVLAFDPSLSATGWAHLRVSWVYIAAEPEVRIRLIAKGTLRVRTAERGYRGTYDKASRMKALIEETCWRETDLRFPSLIAWEAPAVVGHRLEASLIAGFCVYEASNRAGVAVSANHASYRLTGSPAHDKHAIGAAVARYVAGTAGRTWNHNERDALAIALTISLDAPEPEPWTGEDDEAIFY